ncbi:MAG: hypothetical protein HYV37_00835 [Candidatus Levyibacteriota bacterium]|nr:MAG: hypothetical protein HYV37_00835 [Candidatus Levybacteria bacterium]
MKLTKEQLKTLSAIVADAGQVFFAATMVPFLFGGIDRISPWVLPSGLGLTLFCWITSILLVKANGKGKK